MPVDQRPTFDLSGNWSPLTRNVLIVLVAVYFAQLTAPALFDTYLRWNPWGQGFQPWQVVTSFFVQGDPFQAFFGWLSVFFFLTPVWRDLGPKEFLRANVIIWAVSVLVTLVLVALGLLDGIQFGYAAFSTMWVAFFGFRHPQATIYLYVLPVKASVFAWVAGFLALLWFLFARVPLTLLPLLFWIGAWAWTHLDGGGIRRARLKWKRRQVEKQLSRFEVIEGGRDGRRKPDEWVH